MGKEIKQIQNEESSSDFFDEDFEYQKYKEEELYWKLEEEDEKKNLKNDDFFIGLGNTKPYFKAAFEGFAGSGKSYTAAITAVGLYKKIRSQKPIVLFDTEKAAKFLKPIFEQENISVLIRESKSLADLKEAMKRCREGLSDILIIDSITHIYENFISSYLKKIGRLRLQFQDWGILKPTWKKEFSDYLVNDPYHIIFTGRAGYEYETEINPETQRREIYKSGIKMKVEGETAYEPDLLVLMERFEEILGKEKKVWREATIIKDRSNTIDGKTFVNPTFKDFEPAVEVMISNPEFYSPSDEISTENIFETEEERGKYIKQKKIILEEIEALLIKKYPSSTGIDRVKKLDLLEQLFKTRSWTAVQDMDLNTLSRGLDSLREIIYGGEKTEK